MSRGRDTDIWSEEPATIRVPFDSATVTLDKKQYEYHGTPLTKEDVAVASVKLNRKVLESSLYDYEVCAEETAGAYVMVYPSQAGREAGYRGSKKVNLKLSADRDLKNAVYGENWKERIPFSQETLYGEGGFYQAQTGVLTFVTEQGTETLVQDRDYTVKYKNAQKVGKVTVTFTGIGRYKGTLKGQYEIVPDLSGIRLSWKNVTAQEDGTLVVVYQKGGAVPEPVLKDLNYNVLKNKTDYTVKLTNHKVPGEIMTCEITGKGNYKGYSRIVPIKVQKGDIGQGMLSVPDKAYSTKRDAWKSKVTIKDSNGKSLSAGVDYDKTVEYQYAGQEEGQLPQAGSVITVTVYGKGCYEGSRITGSYRIYQNSIGKLKFAIDAKEYTGAAVELSGQDIHVYATKADMQHKRNELPSTCYEIVGYQNNSKAGKAKVTLRGLGEYGGTTVVTFVIQKKKYLVNHIKAIKLDKTNVTVNYKDYKETGMPLIAEVTPENPDELVTNPLIIWTVSDSKIASVEQQEDPTHVTIWFRKTGTVTITATTQDSNRKAQCKITVQNIPVLLEAETTIEGEAGETHQLHVEWDTSIESAPVKFTWKSSNDEKVSVDETGLVTLKKTGAAVITLSVSGSEEVQQCYVIVKGEEVLPEGRQRTYVQKPGTEDDAIAINALLREWEWSPNMCDYLYIPAGVYRIGATVTQKNGFGGIVLTDNQKLVLSPGALLIAIANDQSHSRVIYAFGRDNVSISGGEIIGEREGHFGKGGEWGHGIQISGCTNVTISDVEISNCWGDGIYLGDYNEKSCDGVTIENCNLHHNRRNNLSITDANNITINGCQFNYAKGTDPQYGIDIEYNYHVTEHVTITNSTFQGNAKASLGIIKKARDVRLENCTLDGNFYNMAGEKVVLKNTTVKGEIVDPNNGIRRE